MYKAEVQGLLGYSYKFIKNPREEHHKAAHHPSEDEEMSEEEVGV